jgi:hypothetical protein
MVELKKFLAELAVDPVKLGEFIHDPNAAMTAAELSDEDKDALKSGFPGIIYARLSGLSIEDAFNARAIIAPNNVPWWPIIAPNNVARYQLPPRTK